METKLIAKPIKKEDNNSCCFNEKKYMKNVPSPILSKEFVNQYKNKKVPWGFNGLGYIVYKRTYSRPILDGSETEEWFQTLERCINGAQDIGAGYTKDEAEKLYDLMFNLKCMYPGRMLWQLGTETINRFGNNGLVNCWFLSIKKIEDFCFLFENLMLGGGVGFSIRREDVHDLPKVKKNVAIEHMATKDADFIVPDSREGWISLLKNVLEAYFETGKGFTYSTILVRGPGEKIKGFGGTASGPTILIHGIEQICDILASRETKKLRSIDVLDICNIIGSIVVSGNVRRSAQIALGDPDDYLFLKAKRWDTGQIPNWRAMSNNTVYADDFNHIVNEVWEGYQGNGEPYGFFNLPLSQKYGRLGEEIKDVNAEGLNPCITASTSIYCADGRGNISMEQLVKEGKDVPVFCYDDNNQVTVRYMRNPRLTGKNKQIYKLTLDDGSTIRVTGNHKFMLLDETYKEVKRLIPGESLKIITKFEASIKDIFPKANSRSQNYNWINNGQKNSVSEHKKIASFHYNTQIDTGFVVHHRDRCGINNSPDNLEIMPREAHDKLHSFDKLGDKNPMRRAKTEWSEEKWNLYRANQSKNNAGANNRRYSGYTNEQLLEHAIILTKSLARRFSTNEWAVYAKKEGLPTQFSKWRMDHLGSITGLSKMAALHCGVTNDHINCDTRTVKNYNRLTLLGYDCEIINNRLLINKKCELCGTPFKISRPEVGLCGGKCINHSVWANNEIRVKRLNTIHRVFESKKKIIREKQQTVYNDLKFELQRGPMKKEWERACKKVNISFEISRKSSPFTSFSQLQEAASTFNHKVMSVELDGIEDVYNGTVDEFHNFFVGGWESKTKNDKKKWVYINNLQCGEIALSNYECCNLSELFLNNLESKKEMITAAKLLYKTQKAVAAGKYIHEETNKVVHANMRLGLSITGVCQSMHKLHWLDDCYKELRAFDKEWSAKKGWPASIKLTCVKPSGTVSLLAGATPGVHPAIAKHYIRRVRMSSTDPLINYCRDNGYHVEFAKLYDGSEDHGTMIASFPCEETNEDTKFEKDMTVIDMLELIKKLQTEWADNAVSATAYYSKEELPIMKEWLKNNYKNSIKSVSFLLRHEHGFVQAPYESISEDEYLKMLGNIKKLDSIKDDGKSVLQDSFECVGGLCPIK